MNQQGSMCLKQLGKRRPDQPGQHNTIVSTSGRVFQNARKQRAQLFLSTANSWKVRGCGHK